MEWITDPAVLALIGTLFAGAGLKFVERWLARPNIRMTENEFYRNQINELRERLDKVEAEVDDWRERYYRTKEEVETLKAHIIRLGIQPPTVEAVQTNLKD